ncbi:MAG: tetratricopeptide repeat protein [Pirellulales bacterium]
MTPNRASPTISGPDQDPRWLPWLLMLAGMAAYGNSLYVPFHFDDQLHIVESRSIESFERPWRLLRGNRPVVKWSLAANYAVGGRQVIGYHVVNLAIHLFAGLVLFGIVRRTLRLETMHGRYASSAPWLAFSIALLWLIHPLQTESVTYVIQRAESLMGLFYLLTLYCAIRVAEGGRPGCFSVAAIVACALGMGTKEVMVTAPLLVLIYDRTFLAGSIRGAVRSRWPLYAGLATTWLLLFSSQFTRVVATYQQSTAGEPSRATPIEYAWTQPGIVLHYLRLAAWPRPLCFDYGWPVARDPLAVTLTLAAVGIMLVGTSIALWRRHPVGFAGAWFFLILAPTSSLFPIKDLAVEHRMYLSLAAVAALTVLLADRTVPRLWAVLHRPPVGASLADTRGTLDPPTAAQASTVTGVWCQMRRPVVLGALAMAVLLGGMTWRRNLDYRSGSSLWRSVLRVAPANHRAHNNLGVALKEENRLDEAARCFVRAIDLNPSNAKAINNLGSVLARQGQSKQAMRMFEEAIRVDPGYVRAYCNLGMLLRSQGEIDQAIDAFEMAVQRKPGSPEAHYLLGNTLAQRGDLETAVEHLRRATKIWPNFADAHKSLGNALTVQGRLDEALDHLQKAVRLQPDAASMLNALAWFLATGPGDGSGQIEQAVRLARQASSLSRDRDPAVLDTLAAAYAARGEFDRAIETAERAERLARRVGDAGLANEIGRHLECYRRGQAYRRRDRKVTESPATTPT